MRSRVERWLALAPALALAACASGVHRFVPDVPVKLGRPYTVRGQTYVPTDDPFYDQIGEASWYGNREQGNRTANGEIFFRQRPSAANKTLPMPSYVEVTRLDTGQRILVRVNDRGPFARDRIIDLSEEAATELGIRRAGHAMVRVRRVTPTRKQRERLQRGYPVLLSRVEPTATPLRTGPTAPTRPVYSPPPVPSAEPPYRAAPVLPTPRPFYTPPPQPAYTPPPRPAYTPPPAIERDILIASPNDPDAADALASALADEGAHVVATGTGYRVVTGPYPDEASRIAALARLRARGYQGAAVLDAPVSQEPIGSRYP